MTRYLLPALMLVASFAAMGRADDLLLEVESYRKAVSEERFAVPITERAASGRRVLVRFFVPGHIILSFQVEEPGVYRGWLRYGAKNKASIGVALDPAEPPDLRRVELPPTGGYIGPGVWGWAKLFEARLEGGEHTLALGNATIRPDCVYLTTTTEPPTDEVIRPDRHIDPKLLALLSQPLDPVRPAWLDGCEEYRLPAWYDRYRVQAHTRLSLRWSDKDIFLTAGAAFRSMGVHTFTRHIKSGSEGAWWPSAIGAIAPAAGDRNLAKLIIDEAHAAGCRILVYHRHMEDAWIAEQHPDWTQKKPDGSTYTGRGPKICFNSPYPEFVLQRLLELAALGADAFYFDELHMEKQGCWCDFCRRKFKQETGLDHPASPDPYDPVWEKLVEFTNRSIERTFLYWRRELHARYPEIVMLVGSHTWPTMIERHMTHRLFRIADSMKTEFSLPARRPSTAIFPLGADMAPLEKDVMIALGYTLARDACGGRPAHIWAHGIQNEESALYAAAGMMAHGCIANLDVAENTIPNMTYQAAFELGDRVSPYLAGTKPLRWAAIHYSELARDRHVLDPDAAWRQVLYPTYGAYRALLRTHLPVGIVTDSQLEDGLLDGYQVLFLPAPDALTQPMRRAVDEFRGRGRLVIEQREEWQWHEADEQPAATDALLRAVEPARPSSVEVTAPERVHAASFAHPDSKRLTVALTNSFTWVYTGNSKKRPPTEEDLTPPPACAGVTVTFRGAAKRVFEAVTGRELAVRREGNSASVEVPEFGPLAVVVIER